MMILMMIDAPEDKRKFVVLYDKYRHLMMKTALYLLHDPYLAEDATYNAFVSLACNIDKLDESEDITTKLYLVACARNAAINLYRKRSSQMKSETMLDEVVEKDSYAAYIESDLENGILDNETKSRERAGQDARDKASLPGEDDSRKLREAALECLEIVDDVNLAYEFEVVEGC